MTPNSRQWLLESGDWTKRSGHMGNSVSVDARPSTMVPMSPAIQKAIVLAFTDSINALLIGVIVAIGIMLPRAKYRRVATLLLAGDWLGVFLLSLVVMGIFDQIQGFVTRFIEGPWLGIILIAIGLVAVLGAVRSQPGGDNRLVGVVLRFVREPTWATVGAGFVLGIAQSATSGPYYGGIGLLSAGGLSAWTRYGGMVWYAMAALSLPTVVAILLGFVRRYPDSAVGRGFTRIRENPGPVTKVGGYVVAFVLCVIGVMQL